jgi:FAD synthase
MAPVKKRVASASHLRLEQQEEVMEISSVEEQKKTETSLSSNEIRQVCKMWETAKICRKAPPE